MGCRRREGVLGLSGTYSPIQDISLPIPQMQNIDFEGLFGNIHMVISFSKQLLSTLEASDVIGMISAVTFSQKAGMGFASGRTEQNSLNVRRVSLGLSFLLTGSCCCSSVLQRSQEYLCCPMDRSAEKHGACVPPWPLGPKRAPLLPCQLLLFRPWAACAFALRVAPHPHCH